jgi:hypothetical protein
MGVIVCVGGALLGALLGYPSAEAHSIAEWDRVAGDVSASNPAGDVAHYEVFTCLASGCSAGTFSKVAQVPQSPLAPSGTPQPPVSWTLTPGTRGEIKVRAVDTAANVGAFSNVEPFDAVPPQAPAVKVR